MQLPLAAVRLVLGKVLFLTASMLILAAEFGRSVMVVVNAERMQAKPAVQTRAEAYPGYLTWMVPEGSVGYGIAGALVLTGIALTVAAEKGKR